MGTALAKALQGSGDQLLPVGQYLVNVPAVGDMVNWRQHPSRARYDAASVPWPTCDYELSQRNSTHSHHWNEFLIGDDCPSFPTYDAAFYAFFYGDFSTTPSRQAPSTFGRVRIVQSQAWLRSVRITPTHLDVRVGGTAIEGTRVELNSPTYRAHKPVGKTGRVRLRLPGGLPEDAWLYLSRSKRWLDYRTLGQRLGVGADPTSGVTVELPDDPTTKFQALLSQGEGLRIEFKRQLPGDNVENKRRVFKTVAAFANADGGTIVFGIDPDEVTIIGLDEIDPRQVRDRLADLVRAIVVPTPPFEVHWIQVGGKALLMLEVGQGTDRPYGILVQQNKPVEFYVRRGATTFPARQDEIRALATPATANANSFSPFQW